MKLFGHPLHAILITFPVGLLSTAVLFDLFRLFTADPRLEFVAFSMIVAGVVVGIPAALFGLLDWLGIASPSRAKRIGLWHGLGNLLVLILFGASAWLRWQADAGIAFPNLAHYLSFVGGAILMLTGWLGGELVYRLGIGVDPKSANSDHG